MKVTDLVLHARDLVMGSGATQDRSVTLTQDLTVDFVDPFTGAALPSVIPVDDTKGLGPCVVEIDFERIRVRSASGNSLEVFGFGRGYSGSQAAPHARGSEVRVNPVFPQSAILAGLRRIVAQLSTDLYGVRYVDATYEKGVVLPSEAYGVIAAYVKDDFTGDHNRVETWTWDPSAGNVLSIPSVRNGGQVRVAYAVRPIAEFDQDDDFEAATGLNSNVAFAAATGAAATMLMAADATRALTNSAEARLDGQARPASLGTTVGRSLMQAYEDAIAREQQRLATDFPIRTHRTNARYVS